MCESPKTCLGCYSTMWVPAFSRVPIDDGIDITVLATCFLGIGSASLVRTWCEVVPGGSGCCSNDAWCLCLHVTNKNYEFRNSRQSIRQCFEIGVVASLSILTAGHFLMENDPPSFRFLTCFNFYCGVLCDVKVNYLAAFENRQLDAKTFCSDCGSNVRLSLQIWVNRFFDAVLCVSWMIV